MAPPHTTYSPQKEGRLSLAIHSLQKNQISSRRRTASTYIVPETTLRRRQKGILPKRGSRAKNRLLLDFEEAELIKWICSMERRGFPPFLIDVKRMAQSVLDRRSDTSRSSAIGKNWIYRFHKAHPDIKARLSRGRDYQRVKNEDPRIIRPWFQRVLETKQRYGILDEDTYNFDETGFAMGLITGSRSSKVITSSESVGRATVTQPGERKWSTTVETISAAGWALPPFVILEGKTHLEYYYQQSLPLDWTIAVSDNGWTNDKLGFHFIKHFDKWTKHRTTGTYRLLILDGHGSHATPEFDLFCSENNIITECLPPHTSHILQPLDVACFGPLKTAYGHLVQDLARQAIFHVDKADFLTMYRQARATIHSEQNIRSAFRATGLIPWNPDYVLSQLPCTPSPPSTSHGLPLASSPWISETPRNLAELAKQTKLVQAMIQHSSQSPTEPLGKVVKSCQQTMTRVVLLEQRVKELEAAAERQTKKKHQSRSQLQHGGILQVQEAQNIILGREQANREADEQFIQQGRQRAPPTCSNCGEKGHRRTTCKVVNNNS
jgi:hypothetical protein